MPPPKTRPSAFIPALADYLEAKFAPYKDNGKALDISWQYTEDEHSPQTNPQGAIVITSNRPVLLENKFQNYQPEEWIFALRLFVSNDNVAALRIEVIEWLELLKTAMRELVENGHSGTFNTVTVSGLFAGVEHQESRLQFSLNQNGGGTAVITALYRWVDEINVSYGGF